MYQLHPLSEQDVPGINAIIRAAVHGWPMPERVCRLSLPLLQYDAVDTEHYRFLGCFLSPSGKMQNSDAKRTLVAIAAWDDNCVHGLYVHPDAQGQGIGRALLTAVARTLPRGATPLTVKAQRVSATFFEQIGLEMNEGPSAYPYTYLLTDNFAPPVARTAAA